MDSSSSQMPSIQLGDIYYILFRHKWKIMLCTIAGLAGAFAFYKLSPPPASSTAKLYIRYVTESQGITATGEEELRTKTPGQRGDTTMASEIAIITSLNVAKLAAAAVGPEKILRGGTDLNAAAAVIRGGLAVEQVKGSAIVNISFTHQDQSLVQPVLTEVVNHYLKQHLEIHRGSGMIDTFLTKHIDELRARLAQTEEDLRAAKTKAGVISAEVSKEYFASTISRLRQEILNAEAFQAEHTAIFEQLTKTPSSTVPEETSTPTANPEALQAYKDAIARIETMRRREQELLVQFTPESAQVVALRASIAEFTRQKQKLETEHPLLLQLPNQPTLPSTNERVNLIQNRIADEMSLLAANEAKTKALRKQLEQVTFEAIAFDRAEPLIQELQRKRQIDEKNLLEYSASLTKARTTEALGGDQISNISQIQTPTPAIRDSSKIKKIATGLAASGFVIGLVWAALLEFIIDRSLRRPKDIEQSLKLPLFLSVPKLKKSEIQTNGPVKDTKLLTDSKDAIPLQPIVPYEGGSALNPYFETLRDRLIAYFESINMRHRPKLVAVTGLGHASGVTTTAVGLARSLSETGEGNVLLVDMTQKGDRGAAMPFYQGKAMADLDHMLAEKSPAKGDNKLVVVSEGTSTEQLSRHLPQRFSQLVPKLKASNFDYIIFDMPPVSQISITPRLASAMDMVMMVVESEKTGKDQASRAVELLKKASTNVGIVLNKTKTYVPAALDKGNDLFLDT